MSRGRGAAVALVVVLLGAGLLKGFADKPKTDHRASVFSGGPEGLRVLYRLFARRGFTVDVHRVHDAAPTGPALFIIPPPARTRWRQREVDDVLAAVEAGELDVVVLCGNEQDGHAGLHYWLNTLKVECLVPDAELLPHAPGTLPAYKGTLEAATNGRLKIEAVNAVPAWVDEAGNVLVTRQRVGAGTVTVVGSASVFANDGIRGADNARVALLLAGERDRVIFDEAHHAPRQAAVIRTVLSRPGAQAGALALALLLPLSLLGFWPRRGDPPRKGDAHTAPAASRATAALAALYVEAAERSSSSPSSDSEGGPTGSG